MIQKILSCDPKECFLLNAMAVNVLYTNHVTAFLCHVTTSFAGHMISFLEPAFKISNGRFTTLVILIVNKINKPEPVPERCNNSIPGLNVPE